MKRHQWGIGAFLFVLTSVYVSSGFCGALTDTGYQAATLDVNVADIIVDNADSNNVAYTGKWAASGVKGSYGGTNSVWAANGKTFTWFFTPTVSGNYEVFMWWTQNSARANNAQVQITDANGTSSVYVNQQSNGAKWNSLGIYPFVGGIKYNVTIIAQTDPTLSTCAGCDQNVISRRYATSGIRSGSRY